MERLDKWAPEETSTVRMLATYCTGFIESNLSEHRIVSERDVIGADCFTDCHYRSIKQSKIGKLLAEPRFSFHTHLATDLLGYAAQTDLVAGLAWEAGWFKAQYDVSRSAGHEHGYM